MDIFDTPPKKTMTFEYRGAPIDPELRPLWRISLISTILLKLCSGNKANSKKLQTLYSLISSQKKRQAYKKSITEGDSSTIINIRFDPLVDRAVDMGIGEKLFILDDAKSIKLSNKGLAFANKIITDNNIFTIEKEFINSFKKSHFNDNTINKLINGDLT